MTQQIRGEVMPLSELRPEVPDWLNAIVLRCLKLDPNKRYQSCSELAMELELGESSSAALVARREPSFCFGCKFELIPGLIFCPGCGKFSHEIFAKGGYSVILRKCEDAPAVAGYLEKAFPDSKNKNVLPRLRVVPSVLFQGVSEAAAIATANELAAHACQVEVLKMLPTRLKLPERFTLSLRRPDRHRGRTVALLPFFVRDRDLYRYDACSSSLVFRLLRRTRPVLSISKLRRAGKTAELDQLIEFAAEAKKLTHVGLKSLLGNLVQLYHAIVQRGTAPDPASLLTLLKSSFEIASRLQACEAYLDSTSLSALKSSIDRIDLKIRESKDTGVIEALIQEKAKYSTELRKFYDVQDEHSRLYLSLVEYHGQLKRLERDSHETKAS